MATEQFPIKLGDRITFRAVRRWSAEKATRKVTGFYAGSPTVTLDGCSGFVVRLDEISMVEAA